MYSFEPPDVVLVKLAAAMDVEPVLLPFEKVDSKSYFLATKGNKPLHDILRKGIDEEFAKQWRAKLPFTDILENLKKLKDAQYTEHVKDGPSKRSRSYKAFVLRLPESCIISVPVVGHIASIEMRVRLSNQACTKSTFPV